MGIDGLKKNDKTLLEKISQLPDKRMLLVPVNPSIQPRHGEIHDYKILELAQNEDSSFKLVFPLFFEKNGATVLVNPNKTTGFLWWKKPKIIIINDAVMESVKKGQSSFDSSVDAFFIEAD